MRLIDLTHTFVQPMPAFPGDPPARLAPVDWMNGTPLFEVTTGMHVGTHMDAPLHMLPGGAAIPEIPLEKCLGPGVLIDARGQEKIDVNLLQNVTGTPGAMVLVWTGLSAIFREPAYYADYPEISPAFAEALVTAKIHLLGLDTPSPDRAPYDIHRILFRGGVLLVENLTNLEALAAVTNFEVIALPTKFQAEAAPARIIARIPGAHALRA